MTHLVLNYDNFWAMQYDNSKLAAETFAYSKQLS